MFPPWWVDATFPLASKGRCGDAKSKAKEMGSPSVNARVLGLWWVFHPSIVNSRDLQVEEGGRVALGGLKQDT